MNDSDSRFLFVEDEEQLDKFLTIEDQVPGLIDTDALALVVQEATA